MNNLTPVRRIPRKNRSLSGEVSIPRLKTSVSYESGLERDFVFINAINPKVTNIVSQPCCIHFADKKGQERHYTPDYLVTFSSKKTRPQLIEIKYSEELQEKASELADQFKAARLYAKDQGWKFLTVTENDIRTPILDNAKRLLPLQARVPNSDWANKLIGLTPSRLSIEQLLDKAELAEADRARGFNAALSLIAHSQFFVDLTQPITPKTIIRKIKKGGDYG
ncbi:MAG: TnsA endonuclease N-terminal domain-containing protein [Methylocystaceae bacterium]|nr:TnsA endonuclease N-terminal domain-containing protein [Methylocystaceae bacterium]